MGAKDTPLVTYFSDEARYADLINGHILDGEQFVSPEDVQEMDGRVVGIVERLGRKTKRIYVEKYRDLVRRIVRGTTVVIVGLENQDQIHYAMPIRILVEDAADYDRQMRKIQKKHRRARDVHGAEFLGGFSKDDKVYPVVTIVLYYGEKPWDGPKDLHGLMNLEDIPEKMRSWINNYPIHILDVRRYPGVEKFQSDLREIFGFLQFTEDKVAAREYVEQNRNKFEAMEEDAYDLLTVLSGSKELAQNRESYLNEGGTVNMCKAIYEWIEDSRNEGKEVGREEGLKEGIQRGEQSKAEKIARNMFQRGMSVEDVAAICEEDVELVKQWFKKYKKKRRWFGLVG